MNRTIHGYSLIELMVSMVIGLFLVGGVLATFSSMRATTAETSSLGEMQENGRYALSVLTNDLLKQGFFGGISGNINIDTLRDYPGEIASDCFGEGLSNRSFPLANGHFRTIWGITPTTNNVLNCITKAKVGSDVLQLKRVISMPVAATQLNKERYYLAANVNYGEIFNGDEGAPTFDFTNLWEYQHHIYYVREDTRGTEKVPVLMQGQLRSDITPPIFFRPLIDGIEIIRFMYGVDTDNDGAVNAFISADNMTNSYWDNENDVRILAVTVYVLARDIMPDNNYENKNSYQLGDTNINFITDGKGDNYRRLLFSSTVTLYNARVDAW